MPRVTCAFCGLPFSVRTAPEGAQHFCCSGCALASRIPVHGDVLPVSRGLVIALALGFGLFNQVLFAVAGAALIRDGRADVGARWALVSMLVGVALFLVNVGFLITAKPRRWSDGLAGLLAMLGVVWAVERGVAGGAAAVWGPMLAVNGWLALWWSRGWLRRALGRRRDATKT